MRNSQHALTAERTNPGEWDWEELSRRCLREARRFRRSPADAEDLAQATLLRAWRYRARCRDPGTRAAWVARICRNEAFRDRHDRPAEAPLEETDVPAAGQDADAHLEALAVRSALADLSDRDRVLVWLRYGLDLTQPAVAAALGMPEGTAKVRLHRLRAVLRDRLEDHGQHASHEAPQAAQEGRCTR